MPLSVCKCHVFDYFFFAVYKPYLDETNNVLISCWDRAFSSFLLQLSLLLTVVGALLILRRDAEDLVLRPLRSMLKIVARYAKNPLSSARTAGKGGEVSSEASDSESEEEDEDREDDNSESDFGRIETEQLITAVSKITELLRKCWGTWISFSFLELREMIWK